MTSSPKIKTASPIDGEAAMLAPWAATGSLDEQDARVFAAAMACDPALAADFASARAERDAVVALAADLGRPSPRALAALFAAIDAEEFGANVTRLCFDRPRAASKPARPIRKFGSLR